MWPKILDMDSEACTGVLRRLELEAYSKVVSALRAQGDLSKEKRKMLQDLSNILNISVERHKAEIRRAVNDELLSTVATIISGPHSDGDWAREGRRIIPLLRRASPLNAFSSVASKVKSELEDRNRTLKSPLETRAPRRSTKSRRECADEKNLSDMIYLTENGDVRVRTPQISVPPLPSKFKALQEVFGGECDVVLLPSGGAVRVKTSALHDDQKASDKKAGGRRKRKLLETHGSQKHHTSATYEYLPPGWQFTSTISSMDSEASNVMPPPTAPASRKSTPGGRGSRRGHGCTPRMRKARGSKGFVPGGHSQAQPEPPYAYEQERDLQKATSGAIVSETSLGGQNDAQVLVVSTGNSTIVTHATMSTASALNSVSSGIVLKTNQLTGPLATAAPKTASIPQMITAAFANGVVGSSASKKQTTTATVTSSSISKAYGQGPVAKDSSALKVLPAGTRILPKPGSSVPMGGPPVFMVSAGQNLMRLTRPMLDDPNGMKVVAASNPSPGSSQQQRLITVSAGAIVKPSSLTSVRPAVTLPQNSSGAARLVQPRIIQGGHARPLNQEKPSVIVVQKGKAIITKDSGMTPRLMTAKSNISKPIVIMSKPSNALSAPGILTNSSCSNQGNVIVLDLSQETHPTSSSGPDVHVTVPVVDESSRQSQPHQVMLQHRVQSEQDNVEPGNKNFQISERQGEELISGSSRDRLSQESDFEIGKSQETKNGGTNFRQTTGDDHVSSEPSHEVLIS